MTETADSSKLLNAYTRSKIVLAKGVDLTGLLGGHKKLFL